MGKVSWNPDRVTAGKGFSLRESQPTNQWGQEVGEQYSDLMFPPAFTSCRSLTWAKPEGRPDMSVWISLLGHKEGEEM